MIKKSRSNKNRPAVIRNSRKRKKLEMKMQPGQENDEAWKVAELATQLVTARFAQLRADAGTFSNNDGTLYNEVEAAIDRAELILDRVERRGERDVHLYQAFEEGEQVSEAAVIGRIKEIGWFTPNSTETVRDRLRTICTHWSDRLKLQLIDVVSVISPQDDAYQKIRNTLAELGDDPYVKKSFPQFGPLSHTLIKGLLPPNLDILDMELQEVRWGEEQALYKWCIDHEPAKGKGKPKYIYRPHELFLFTENHDWFPSKLLTKKRAQLLENFRPGPRRSNRIMNFIEFNNQVWRALKGGTCDEARKYLENLKDCAEKEQAKAKNG